MQRHFGPPRTGPRALHAARVRRDGRLAGRARGGSARHSRAAHGCGEVIGRVVDTRHPRHALGSTTSGGALVERTSPNSVEVLCAN